MKIPRTSQLYDEKKSTDFYEQRYQQGYMDEWPAETKARIAELLRELDLPAEGEALDFGCGNGVLTEVIRQSLPSWRVYGTDVSHHAVANARKRYPECTFFQADDTRYAPRKFDLVFSNHVFEHVFNLDDVFRQMDGRLKPKSCMLHILPCGNAGSYEHDLCSLRRDGFDPALGNRFFFEDEGHVRRLTTLEFTRLAQSCGFELASEYYANQYHGAIDWITRCDLGFIRLLTDSSQAKDGASRMALLERRLRLMSVRTVRRFFELYSGMLAKSDKQLKHYVLMSLTLPLFFHKISVDVYLKRKSAEEWRSRRNEPNGSEMYLFFKRG